MNSDCKALLVAEKDELQRDLADLGVAYAPGEYDPNFADIGKVTAERSEQEVLIATLHDALVDVDAALIKLAEGSFGTCEKCSAPINPDRLRAKPAARRCVACAALP